MSGKEEALRESPLLKNEKFSSKLRRYAVEIFISCLGFLVVSPYLAKEIIDSGSLLVFLKNLTLPEKVFYHSVILFVIPAFMIIGFFYQKEKNLADREIKLKQSMPFYHEIIENIPIGLIVWLLKTKTT